MKNPNRINTQHEKNIRKHWCIPRECRGNTPNWCLGTQYHNTIHNPSNDAFLCVLLL
jgi:hypothetical protein